MDIKRNIKITCQTKKLCLFKTKGSTKDGCIDCSMNKSNEDKEGLEDKSEKFIREGYF
jgi:hypothetical protein